MIWRLIRLFGSLRTFLVAALVIAVFLVTTAATGSSAQVANAIVGFVLIVLVPFVLPFGLKLINADGKKMVAITYLVSFVIAALALFISGEVPFPPDFSSAVVVMTLCTAAFGLQQGVFHSFKDSAQLGPYLK